MTGVREKVLRVHESLVRLYGQPDWRPHMDALSELVSTILSQNTNDVNRDVAFESLRHRFPTWEMVRDAPVEEIEEAIRPAGLAPQKAPRIKRALATITAERGELNIDFLRDMPVDEAKAWLTGLDGVGPKTTAIVLLFALGRPAFPVDTHVHRVSRRLGLIPDRLAVDKAHDELEALVPPELYYPFHLNVILHGRRVCHARKPACEECGLRAECAYFTAMKTWVT